MSCLFRFLCHYKSTVIVYNGKHIRDTDFTSNELTLWSKMPWKPEESIQNVSFPW